MGGLVLDAAVDVFKGFVVFQPIINGIGGNLVSVQASKISTMLHQSSIIGIVPPHASICEPPWRALIKGVPYARSAKILILMSIPGQILFIYVADYIHMSQSTIGPAFVLSYLCVSLLQVSYWSLVIAWQFHVFISIPWNDNVRAHSTIIRNKISFRNLNRIYCPTSGYRNEFIDNELKMVSTFPFFNQGFGLCSSCVWR